MTQRSTEQRPSVIVIDDDDDIREELGSLLGSVGFQFQLFGSVADFLKTELPDRPTCVVSDVRMPGQSGLELQRGPDQVRECRGVGEVGGVLLLQCVAGRKLLLDVVQAGTE